MNMLKGLILLSLVLGIGFVGQTPRPAYATEIEVTTTDDELNNDGDCSLREAIQAASSQNFIGNFCVSNGTAKDKFVNCVHAVWLREISLTRA